MKKLQGLQSVEDTRKELITCRLNDLVTDVFEEKKPNGTPMKDDGGKILTVGFFVRNVFCRYINVKDDSPAKMFMRCSEVLYQMLTQGD